jgi:NCS1 family nucleobase:cation symporter-1
MSNSAVRRFFKRIEIPREDDAPTSAYMNRDTRPLPPDRRTYGPWTFVGLWVVTGSFNIGGWSTGSSLISLGLNVWQAMVTVIVGNLLVGLICVLSGMPGAKWHIGFSILQKSSWGMIGGYFPLVNRIVLSFIWYSTQVWWGGQCVKTFLAALWPNFNNLNRPLANGTMTTADFTAFIIFALLCLPLIRIKPEKYKIPFGIAAITVFILLIYYLVKAKGGGSLLKSVSSVAGVEQAEGTHLAWMLVLGIVSNIGAICTHIFSQSDYTRFARRPQDQLVAQLIMVPLGTIVVALIGIICASCAAQLYPEEKTLSGANTQLCTITLTFVPDFGNPTSSSPLSKNTPTIPLAHAPLWLLPASPLSSLSSASPWRTTLFVMA